MAHYADDDVSFMDIDDEYTIDGINSQLAELRKDKLLFQSPLVSIPGTSSTSVCHFPYLMSWKDLETF